MGKTTRSVIFGISAAAFVVGIVDIYVGLVAAGIAQLSVAAIGFTIVVWKW